MVSAQYDHTEIIVEWAYCPTKASIETINNLPAASARRVDAREILVSDDRKLKTVAIEARAICRLRNVWDTWFG